MIPLLRSALDPPALETAKDWLPPTLSQVLAVMEPEEMLLDSPAETTVEPEVQWQRAIAALSHLLAVLPTGSASPFYPRGFILAGPTPVFQDLSLLDHFASWVFTPETSTYRLLPATDAKDAAGTDIHTIPLLPADPLAREQFCLVLTPQWSVLLVLGMRVDGYPSFQFSFAPETIQQAWQVLRSRILLTRASYLSGLEQWLCRFSLQAPDYKTVSRFSRFLLAEALPPPSPTQSNEMPPQTPGKAGAQSEKNNPTEENGRIDIELLQAIAHEVRTPLATIRTLISLVLKRPDLPREVMQRLEAIRRECSEQIDRFSLIFRAAELTSSSPAKPSTGLTSVSLDQVFADGIPRWQQQAARRNLTLEVLLPPQLPAVVSDPVLLDQMLTGLIAHFSHSLPIGSRIQVKVTLAGNQLKLQLRSLQTSPVSTTDAPPLKSVGQVLMLQPETGNLSLSLPVTQNLFHVLGGKMKIRQVPHQAEILTIFLPLGHEGNAY